MIQQDYLIIGAGIGGASACEAIRKHARISPEEAYDKAIDKKKFRQFLKNPPDDWTDE